MGLYYLLEKMKKHSYLLIILFFFCLSKINGQQDFYFNMFNYHLNLINPAAAGKTFGDELILSYKYQWIGIEESPQSSAISFNSAISNKFNLGAVVLNDRTFIETQTQLFGQASYLVPLSNSVELFLGLQLGGNNFSVNFNNPTTPGVQTGIEDTSIVNYSNFLPNVGAGVFLNISNNYYITLSAPKILESKRFKENEGFVANATDKMHLYFGGGATNIYLTPTLGFNFSMIGRYVNGVTPSVLVNAGISIQNRVNFDIGYFDGNAVNLNVLTNINNYFSTGISYQNNLFSDISLVTGGTAEIIVKYNLTGNNNERTYYNDNFIRQPVKENNKSKTNKKPFNRRNNRNKGAIPTSRSQKRTKQG